MIPPAERMLGMAMPAVLVVLYGAIVGAVGPARPAQLRKRGGLAPSLAASPPARATAGGRPA